MLSSYTFNGRHLEFLDLLSITIPSTLCGILAIGIFSWFRGKDLDKDPEFQKFISVPENHRYVYGDAATPAGPGITAQQLDRHVDFPRHYRPGGGAGAFSDLRPSFGGKPLSMVPGDPDVYADGRGADRHHYPHQPGVYL